MAWPAARAKDHGVPSGAFPCVAGSRGGMAPSPASATRTRTDDVPRDLRVGPQRDDRVDPRGAACREVRREQRDNRQA